MLGKIFGYFKNIECSDIVATTIRQLRTDICKKCINYRKDFTYLFLFKKKGVSQCGICKCGINDKTLFANEKCPINKW